jgi:hypothetical protein
MLARVLSAAVNGIEAFPVEMEVNSGWGNTVVVLIISIPPIGLPVPRQRLNSFVEGTLRKPPLGILFWQK